MSTKAQRGTKRTCQNPECGSRFYDLSRDPIVCPICQTAYRIEPGPSPAAEDHRPGTDKAALRKSKKPVYDVEGVKPEDAPDADADDTLVPIEDEAEPAVADEDETFLEAEEEDGTDMSNIIGPVAGEDEQP
jgi:uncharacterized protein (TIGR02300 family)